MPDNWQAMATLAALRLLCVSCGEEAYFSPARGGAKEVETGHGVCDECRGRLGLDERRSQ
jgi:hypothetical protein